MNSICNKKGILEYPFTTITCAVLFILFIRGKGHKVSIEVCEI